MWSTVERLPKAMLGPKVYVPLKSPSHRRRRQQARAKMQAPDVAAEAAACSNFPASVSAADDEFERAAWVLDIFSEK